MVQSSTQAPLILSTVMLPEDETVTLALKWLTMIHYPFLWIIHCFTPDCFENGAVMAARLSDDPDFPAQTVKG
jgi:hypothetical protein